MHDISMGSCRRMREKDVKREGAASHERCERGGVVRSGTDGSRLGGKREKPGGDPMDGQL